MRLVKRGHESGACWQGTPCEVVMVMLLPRSCLERAKAFFQGGLAGNSCARSMDCLPALAASNLALLSWQRGQWNGHTSSASMGLMPQQMPDPPTPQPQQSNCHNQPSIRLHPSPLHEGGNATSAPPTPQPHLVVGARGSRSDDEWVGQLQPIDLHAQIRAADDRPIHQLNSGIADATEATAADGASARHMRSAPHQRHVRRAR